MKSYLCWIENGDTFAVTLQIRNGRGELFEVARPPGAAMAPAIRPPAALGWAWLRYNSRPLHEYEEALKERLSE